MPSPTTRAHRGLPKNSALIKFLSEPGNRQILMKTENYYLQDQQKEMPVCDAELYFVIDEKNNQIDLTDKGIELYKALEEIYIDEINFLELFGKRITEDKACKIITDVIPSTYWRENEKFDY